MADILTAEEREAIVLAALWGASSLTADQIGRAVAWARQVRHDAILLGLVLDGRVRIDVTGPELTFGERGPRALKPPVRIGMADHAGSRYGRLAAREVQRDRA